MSKSDGGLVPKRSEMRVEIARLTAERDRIELENEKLRRKVVHYITEARYHRDCERLCASQYQRLKLKIREVSE